jgi:tRNA(Ile)-lysidine synthase
VQDLPHRALAYIRRHQLLKPGDRVGVAVSGGADSVALLRLLLELRKELGVVLSVVHFNHQLRGADSDTDERFVAELAAQYKLQFHKEIGDVAAQAAPGHSSIEAVAREMRYGFFARLFRENCLDRVATGHTLDDQAETVLLRIVRGAGTRGLAGIYPQLAVAGSQFSGNRQEMAVVRPLLEVRRPELETYLNQLGQDWREDKSNHDLRFARNRVRHGILPRLEKGLNPAVREALAETAEIARAEEEYWQTQLEQVLVKAWNAADQTLHVSELLALPLALRRRVVRAACESLGLRLEFRHVGEILEIAAGSGKTADLPGGWAVSRLRNDLRFVAPGSHRASPPNYEYILPVPGRVAVAEAGAWFEAVLVPADAAAEYNRENLFDPELLDDKLQVRNWRPGDRFWPAHTKSPKKIKELLQERKVTGPERKTWPVLVSAAEIVWLRGFPVPSKLQPREGSRPAVTIREIELANSAKERAPSYEPDLGS